MDDNGFGSVCINPSTEFLDQVTSEYGSFTQSESCPSLSSSFLSIDTNQLSFENIRQDSTGSTSPDDFTTSSASATSPLTPLGAVTVNTLYRHNAWPKIDQHEIWQPQGIDPDAMWLSSEESICVMNSYQPLGHFQPAYFCPGRPKSAIDPPLSRAVFHNALPAQRPTSVDENHPWPVPYVISHPQTVAPNATFQAMLPSSPLSRNEPNTPLKHHRATSSLFTSSPLSGGASSMLASQWDVDESKYVQDMDYPDIEEGSAFVPRLLRSSGQSPIQCEKSSPLKLFPSKSGVNCEAVVPMNTHACSVPGCVDKDGRPKRFKRQEHRKRHEKTVHDIYGGRPQFSCWVVTGNKVCGRMFGRRDNLKSHWKKTHGRRSNNQRNPYVATLDETSKYHDPDWKGPLTADGLPVGHPKWPEIRG